MHLSQLKLRFPSSWLFPSTMQKRQCERPTVAHICSYDSYVSYLTELRVQDTSTSAAPVLKKGFRFTTQASRTISDAFQTSNASTELATPPAQSSHHRD